MSEGMITVYPQRPSLPGGISGSDSLRPAECPIGVPDWSTYKTVPAGERKGDEGKTRKVLHLATHAPQLLNNVSRHLSPRSNKRRAMTLYRQ